MAEDSHVSAHMNKCMNSAARDYFNVKAPMTYVQAYEYGGARVRARTESFD